jgi:hypothetical protein
MTDALERIWKEAAVAHSRYEKTSVRIADVPAEIRTEPLPNASPECYRYGHLLGSGVIRPRVWIL